MKKILTTALCVGMTLTMFAGAGERGATREDSRLFPYQPKAKAELLQSHFGNLNSLERRSKQKSEANVSTFSAPQLSALPASSLVGYLDGPNGDIWFYAGDYTYGSNNEINGFEMTVYDPEFKKLGTIRDNITLAENETRVAEVSIGPTITQKFFNVDNNYEIMVGIATNTTQYVNNYTTRVYSIQNIEEGATSPVLTTIAGYYCSAINTAQDAWSENFFITFLTDEATETPEVGGIINGSDYHFVTYKKAGYSGGPVAMLDKRFPSILVSGPDGIPFNVSQKDGVPYFSINHLKYCWYEDPYDFTNDNPTANNELIVEVYAPASAYSSTAELYSTSRFPLNTTADDLFFLYLGNFQGNLDFDMERNSDGTPCFYLSRAHILQGGDSYSYDYEVYDGANKGLDSTGTLRYTIGKGMEVGIFMNDLPGFDPQVLFAYQDGGIYRFRFVNVLTGQVEHTIPFNFNSEEEYLNMNTLVSRVASGDSYIYAVPQTRGISDDNGDMHSSVVFCSTEGDILGVDDLNLGQNIDLAQIYSGPESYNPYIFNLDDNREYMVLLKRRTPGADGNHEELSVVSSDASKGTLFNIGPDEEMGNLASVGIYNTDTDNPKMIVYYMQPNPGNWVYTTTYYDLPFTLFEAGDGTLENPYEISTLGGLKQMKAFPSAHFALVSDIDGAGATIVPSNYELTGSLDGRGHTISNLKVSGRALIPSLRGQNPTTGEDGETSETDHNLGAVKNLNFLNSEFDATVDKQGLVVGSATSAFITNVHAYNCSVMGDGDLGGLVGRAALYSTIAECSFNGEIASQGAVGGVVWSTFTSSVVNACAFSGKINGGTNVGGILGEISSNAGKVTNCHVKADITGSNTIGGIAGSATRIEVMNNYVEGTLTATENARWGGGAKTGGVVGSFPNSQQNDGEDEVDPLIQGNFVALTSITAPEVTEGDFPGQNNTVHRIVGYTRANEAEEQDYDEEYNPIYGPNFEADKALKDNYAISTLAIVEPAIADDAASTEGKSIEAGNLSRDFFADTLGFRFGYEAAEPWAGTETSPRLYFENGLLVITPAKASVEVSKEVEFVVSLYGEELTEEMIEGFTCDYNESLLEMSNMEMAEDGIHLTLKGLAEGECDLTVGLNGQTVKARVSVTKFTAINGVTADAKLAFDGNVLRAEGCAIDVFNTAGTKVLSGRDNVSTANLASGIYVVTATSENGRKTLKIRVK